MHALKISSLYRRLIIGLLLAAAAVIAYPAASAPKAATLVAATQPSVLTGSISQQLFALRHSYDYATQPPPAQPAVITTTVQSGEGLSQVSQRVYGDPAFWTELLAANQKAIGGYPYYLDINQVLIVPPKDAQPPAVPGGGVVTVAAVSQSPSATPAAPAPVAAPAQPSGSPQAIAMTILTADGWAGQFSCLDGINTRESGWNVYATNPGSGAYGIPQALPGSKMAVAGPDWQTSAQTQLSWEINFYIKPVYGTPCNAWAHEQAYGWY